MSRVSVFDPWKLVRLVCLYFVALVLVSTGIGKLLDVQGFIDVIDTYKVFPNWFQPFIAVFMVVAELRLAEWLVTARKPWQPAFVSILLHVSFTGWAILALLRGLDIGNCGCFGVFWARPLTWSTVGEDLFMTFVSAVGFFLAKRGH